MRHLFVLLFGIAVGAAIAIAGAIYNPLGESNERVPINPRADGSLELFTGSLVTDAVAYTNSGGEYLPRRPADIEELWNPELDGVHASVQVLTNASGEPVGVGVKFAALSDEARFINGKLLVNSVWNVYLPGFGSFFVDQQENYWPMFRSVWLPAWRDEGRRWSGQFDSDLTIGPRGTLEGILVGGSGVLRGHRGEAREAARITSYSLGAQHTSASDVRRSLLIHASPPQPGPALSERSE